MASPWAKLEDEANATQAPPPPGMLTPATMGGTPSMPPVQAPLITRLPTAGEQQISNDQQQLQKVRWNQSHPWGTAPTYDAAGVQTDPGNHPGKLGKIAHAFSTLGNIAGDIFAPAVTANIPGSQLNMQEKEGSLAKRLNTEIGDESQNQFRGSEQAKNEEETAEMPGKAAEAKNVSESEIGEHNAQAANLLHPQAKTDFEAWQAQNPGKPISAWLEEKASHAPDKLDPLKEQAKQEYMRLHPGATIDQFLHDYAVNTQAPQRAPVVNMFVPGANGESTLQTIHAGQTVGPGAQTAAGLNSMNTPTTNQRTAAGRAETVLAMVPEVTGRLDSMRGQIGPEMGRWNDFMQGRVGTNNPDFAALRSDLLMMSSAVALAHAQGRLPENLREEFDRAINAPKQTPDNLKATINAMVPWLQHVQSQGGNQQAPAPQQQPAIPPGYIYNANGPKGAGYYAPTAK